MTPSTPRDFSARIHTKPHAEQRYETVGDWTDHSDVSTVSLSITVSRSTDWRHAALIGVHELIEAICCKHSGITQSEVDDFDYAHRDFDEPGDHPSAPYRQQHRFATIIERLLAAELGIDWRDYEAALERIE